MIRFTDNISELSAVVNDALGCRIVAAKEAYPNEEFAQCWISDGGKIAVGKLDAAITVAFCGEPDAEELEELKLFLSIVGGQSVLMPYVAGFEIEGFSFVKEGRVMIPNNEMSVYDEAVAEPQVREAFLLISECFGGFGGDAAYADLSHRCRHGQRRIRGLANENGTLTACAITMAETATSAVMGGVCSDPKLRGKGYATRVVKHLSRELLDENKAVFLFAATKMVPFYEKMGFGRSMKWAEYQVK